jgi:death-on-curing protein
MNHAFLDGNKRIAFFATDVFLRLNGWRIEVGAEAANDHLVALSEAQICNFAHLEPWLRSLVRPLTAPTP